MTRSIIGGHGVLKEPAVTGETITDAEIRALCTALHAEPATGETLHGLVATHDALGRSHRRAKARAHCAELLTAYREGES